MLLEELTVGERFTLCRTGQKYLLLSRVDNAKNAKVRCPKGKIKFINQKSKVEKYNG